MNQDTRNKEFKIPHAINKGYPFAGMPSRAVMPEQFGVNRDPETGKIGVMVDYSYLQNNEELSHLVNEIKERVEDKRTAFEDFLLFRLYETSEALKLAEGQIQDIFEEQPFIPEDFGFEVIHKQKSVGEQPQRIWTSKYNPNIALFRKPGDINDKNWNPSIWTIQIFNQGTDPIKDEDVLLPCHRIAYAYFYAKQIQVEPSVVNEENHPSAQSGE